MIARPSLADFRTTLRSKQLIQDLRDGLIGEDLPINGPFGQRTMIYADYVASGRALRQVEEFILNRILPFYANSHSEASLCGEIMTGLRREARLIVAAHCSADRNFATVFAGSGATTGLNYLVSLFGLPDATAAGRRPLVLHGPYEHHSNILPWRESGAEVIEIPEAFAGGPDLAELERILAGTDPDRIRLGAFSAASNVTGIVTDPDPVTTVLKRHGALAVWDYAGGGPYLSIDMRAGTPFEKDAIVLSPHKFIGGPSASGVMIVRKAAVVRSRPVHSGGGTVNFVSPWHHDYSNDIATRSEAGTPNVIGDLRAALAVIVKDAIGQSFMDLRNAELRERAIATWNTNPNIELLGNDSAASNLPIFSMRVRDARSDGYLHHQLFTRMLSDCYGIQARGGCACAGPYGHRLLNIGSEMSGAMRAAIASGQEIRKPGWTRLNFCVLMENEKADAVISAVDSLARNPYPWAELYQCDESTARFRPVAA